MKIPKFLYSWKFYTIIVIILWLIVFLIIYVMFFNSSNKSMNCLEDKYNCSDFSSYEEAKEIFDLCETDIHQLDNNGDKIPCEGLG